MPPAVRKGSSPRTLSRRPIMRRRLFPGIPLLLLSFLVAFQDRVPITAGSSIGGRNRADTESPSSTPPARATMFLTARTFGVAGLAYSVEVGDFNGDGKPDLVTAGGFYVSVLLGKGNGDFESAVSNPVGANLQSVAVGDFNGDGNLDLAVANQGSNDISILLGKSDGTFQAAVNYASGQQGP